MNFEIIINAVYVLSACLFIFGSNINGTEIGSNVNSANCYKCQRHIVAAYYHNKDLQKLSAFLATARAKKVKLKAILTRTMFLHSVKSIKYRL